MTCARTGNADAVKALLARKADVRAKEPARDQTALMTAAADGHVKAVQLLLAAGADVHARSRVTRAVINRANPNDITAAVVGEVSQGGSTPLLFAARQGDARVGELLLAAGADVNDIAPDGTSALTMAVHSNHTALARLLLENGANPAIALQDGTTLLMAAAGVGSETRLFDRRDHIAVLKDFDEAGNTALRGAAKMNYPSVVAALVARGARLDVRNKKGETPLAVASGEEARTALRGAGAKE